MAGLRKKSLLILMAGVLLVSYLAVYALLSAGGRYEASCEAYALAIDEAICTEPADVWQPQHVVLIREGRWTVTNALGYVFYPLVLLDHLYWHPKKMGKHWGE